MFEDSTFESANKLKTKSKYWMIATAILNATVVTILIRFLLFIRKRCRTRRWQPCWWPRHRHPHRHRHLHRR